MRTDKRRELPLHAKNVLRSTNDPYLRVADLRRTIGIEHYSALTDWLSRFAERCPAFSAGRCPKSYTAIRRERRILPPLSLHAELQWAACYMESNRNILVQFVKDSEQLDNLTFSGTGEQALARLSEIERSLGYSLWSVERRIALLQFVKGLEEQKAYLGQLRSSTRSTTVEFIAYFISERNEATTNPERFRSELIANIPRWTASPEFVTYALFRLADHWRQEPSTIAQILRWEFVSPAVDYYETFIKLATRAIVEKQAVAKQFLEALVAVHVSIPDPRIARLLFLGTSNSLYLSGICPSVPSSAREVAPSESVSTAVAVPPSSPMDAWELACQAADSGLDHIESSGTLGARIADLFLRVATKTTGFSDAYVELLRLATNFQQSSFAAAVALIGKTQMLPDAVPDPHLAIQAAVNAGDFHPSFITAFSAPQRLPISQLLQSGSPSLTLITECVRANILPISALPSSLDSDAISQILIDAALDRQDYTSVLEVTHSRPESPNVRYRRSIWRATAFALIKANRLNEAIEFIVEKVLQDSACVCMMPIRLCFQNMTEEFLAQVAGKLTTPIFVDLVCRNAEDHLTELRHAYEDFLLAHGLEKPSQLRGKEGEFCRDHLVYYLRNVCIPRVMQLSIAFDSSRALEDERVQVCSYLKELDRAESSAYDSEIREITRKQSIHKGLREVEQSKIWIDQEPLRQWATRHLRESFDRYQALLAAGINPGTDSRAAEFTSVDDIEPKKHAEIPELPADEVGALFVKMVSQFIMQCFLHPQHGLNSYLSLRVRHGVLSGQMRAPLEAEKIVTLRKQAGSGEYVPNVYWIERLSYLDPDMALAVDARLRAFSRAYDDLIDTFTAEYIQIRREDKPKGLFSAGFVSSRLLLMASDIHPDTTFDSFLDLCFELFWDSVDISLELVRNHITAELQAEFNKLFTTLLSDLDEITRWYPTPELDNAVRNAHTSASYSLEQVKDWFRQPKPLPPTVMTFRSLVEISLQAVKNMHRDFDPDITFEIEELPVFFQLQKFTDILIIILDNIWRHSSMHRPGITIKAFRRDDYLHIEVSNQIAPGVMNAKSQARVSEISSKIKERAYQRAVTTEGGTGLIKIRNIVGAERDSMTKVSFGFESEERFYVHLQLPSTVYEVETETLQ